MVKKIFKSALSLLLTLTLVLSLLPAYAFADEKESENLSESVSDEAVEIETSITSSSAITSIISEEAITGEAPVQEAMAMRASAITVIPMDRSRNIDSIVAMAKTLTHSGFDYSKVTRYATTPSFTAPYAAGSLASSDIEDALNALKMVRYIAGLPYKNVEFTDELNNIAQHGAVLLAASNQYNHSPTKPDDMDEAFYYLGYQGCGNSNIFAGLSNISDAVLGWAADSGANNIETAGHRRWVLNPGGQNFGIGYAQMNGSSYGGRRANMHVSDGFASGEADTYVAWPSSGDFPIQYFIDDTDLSYEPEYPWSINLGAAYQEPTREDIKMTLTRTRDGKVWTFNSSTPQLGEGNMSDNSMHLAVDNGGYGMRKAIIFRPDVTSLGAIKDGDIFNVSLSGIKTSDGEATTLNYSINFFDLEKEMDRSSVNITVKHGSELIQGATVTIDGKTLTTGSNGLAMVRVNNNRSYSYTVTKAGYETETGSVRVGTDTVSIDVPIEIPVDFTIADTIKTYNGAAQGVSVSANSAVAYTVKYNGSAEVPKDAGTYSVLVETDTDGFTGTKTSTFTINKANITVQAENKIKKIGTADPSLTTLITAGQLFGADVFTGELTRIEGEAVGTYAINKGSLALSNNYNMTFVSGILEILDKDPQNIAVTGLTNKIYGDAPFSLNVTADNVAQLSNFSFSSSDTDVAEINSSGQITIKGGGTTVITVTEPGNTDYAQFVWAQQLLVDKTALYVTADDKAMTYGDLLPNWTITYSGFVLGEDENNLTAKPSVELTTVGKIKAGVHNLIAANGDSSNYDFNYINGTLSVEKKEVVVSGLSVFDKEYQSGDVSATIKNFEYTLAGLIQGDDVRIDINNLTAKFEDDAIGEAKTVTINGITLIGSDKDNYNLTSTTFITTADIKPVVTAQDIADTITVIQPIPKDATHIEIPILPEGFTMSIKSSDNPAIDTSGNVSPVDNDTDVKLIFTVTKISDATSADTQDIIATVLASTKHTITATAGSGGSVEGSGIYNKNANAVLKAVASSNYRFGGWYEDNNRISDSTTYSFTVTSDRVFEARFTYVSPSSPSNSGGGSSSGSSGSRSAAINPRDAEFDTSSPEDITITLTKRNYTLLTVKNGEYVLKSDEDYTVDENRITIKAEYLLTLKKGKNTIVLDMSGGTDPRLVITIEEAEKLPNEEIGNLVNEDDEDSEDEVDNPFKDVSEDDWYYSSVIWAYQNDLFSGTDLSEFSPDMPMTRAMLVTVLARLNNADLSSYINSSFDDVGSNMWYTTSVEWARANRLVSGMGDNSFSPNAEITRQDFAAILVRYAEFTDNKLSVTSSAQFSDNENITDYAKEAVYTLKDAGIINGRTGNIFDPRASATRAEVAAMIRLYTETISK